MLGSSALAHRGSLKTTAVNNTAGSMIAFISIILTATLVERLAAVASRSLTCRIRKAQFASTKSPDPIWYPKYRVICQWQSTITPSSSDRETSVLRNISSFFAGCTDRLDSSSKRRTRASTAGNCRALCNKNVESSTKADNFCSWKEGRVSQPSDLCALQQCDC